MTQLWLLPDARPPSVAQLWQRLEAFLRRQAPVVLETLNPPATDDQIGRAMAQLGGMMPADLAESLRVHDGQRGEQPLVPAEYDERRGEQIATWGSLLPLSEIVRDTLEDREGLRQWNPDKFAFFDEFDGPVLREGGWSWITFIDPGSGDRVGLDVNPPPDGRFGQVLSIEHDPGRLSVLAPSYRSWFERLVERYESGRYAIQSGERQGDCDVVDRRNP